jgi:hypothetical protein
MRLSPGWATAFCERWLAAKAASPLCRSQARGRNIAIFPGLRK